MKVFVVREGDDGQRVLVYWYSVCCWSVGGSTSVIRYTAVVACVPYAHWSVGGLVLVVLLWIFWHEIRGGCEGGRRYGYKKLFRQFSG